MDDLVQWLRAQLDEDERIARATHPVFLTWDYDDCVMQIRDLGNGNELANVLPRHAYGEHMAEWDPARVLREIDAKRASVDDLAEFIHWGARKGLDYQEGVDVCERTLKRLALPYADRPGYLEEWRP